MSDHARLLARTSILLISRRCNKDGDGGTGQPPLLNTLMLVTVILG